MNDWLDFCILDWSNTPPPGKIIWPNCIDCCPVEEFVDTFHVQHLLDSYNNINNNLVIGNDIKCIY